MQVDESVAGTDQLCNGDSATLLDEICHGLQLLLGNEDELAPVVHHPTQLPTLLQALHTGNGILSTARDREGVERGAENQLYSYLCFQLEFGSQVFHVDDLHFLEWIGVEVCIALCVPTHLDVFNEIPDSSGLQGGLLVCGGL